jgi:hypothetical protein
VRKLNWVLLCCWFLATNVSASGWDTYRNDDFAFRIKYPSFLKVSKSFSKSYLLNDQWSIANQKGNNDDQQYSVFEIELLDTSGRDKQGEPYYYKSFIRIGVSTNVDDVKNCETKPANLSLVKTVNIDQNNFTEFSFDDAAMTQFVDAKVFRKAERNRCYSIEYVQTGSNTKYMPAFLKVKQVAPKIIGTFKFLSNEW